MRLALAKRLGADYAVNTVKKDFGEATPEACGPDKADVIFECAEALSFYPNAKFELSATRVSNREEKRDVRAAK